MDRSASGSLSSFLEVPDDTPCFDFDSGYGNGEHMSLHGSDSDPSAKRKKSNSRRPNHNELERKRRLYQREMLTELRNALPNLGSEKASTTSIMLKAKDYIDSLLIQIGELQDEVNVFRQSLLIGDSAKGALEQMPRLKGAFDQMPSLDRGLMFENARLKRENKSLKARVKLVEHNTSESQTKVSPKFEPENTPVFSPNFVFEQSPSTVVAPGSRPYIMLPELLHGIGSGEGLASAASMVPLPRSMMTRLQLVQHESTSQSVSPLKKRPSVADAGFEQIKRDFSRRNSMSVSTGTPMYPSTQNVAQPISSMYSTIAQEGIFQPLSWFPADMSASSGFPPQLPLSMMLPPHQQQQQEQQDLHNQRHNQNLQRQNQNHSSGHTMIPQPPGAIRSPPPNYSSSCHISGLPSEIPPLQIFIPPSRFEGNEALISVGHDLPGVNGTRQADFNETRNIRRKLDAAHKAIYDPPHKLPSFR